MNKFLLGLCLWSAAIAGHASAPSDWFVEQSAKAGLAAIIVITPGYRVLIDGNPVAVFGNQLCPQSDGMRVWFIGGDPQGGDGCAVIEKDTATVPMQLAINGKLVIETWKVERSASSRMSLRRPNGGLIVPAK